MLTRKNRTFSSAIHFLATLLFVLSTLPTTPCDAAESSWTDLPRMLVTSDGTRKSVGNDRDQGSMIVFFDPEDGNGTSGEIYWWDGQRIVDSSGSPSDSSGQAYGADPLSPNEKAVIAFKYPIADPRLPQRPGFPDWYLLRRGRVHRTFDISLSGGRSIDQPMVVAAYGPKDEGRAIVNPTGRSPFSAHNRGDAVTQFHQVLAGLELHCGLSHLGMHRETCTSPGKPGVPTWLIEDCKIINGQMNYLPRGTTMRRSISAFRWSEQGHNQGYFNSDFGAAPTFEEVIFYKNGYKDNPMTDADPRRTIFDRNIYQGGGSQMGHTYRNIISADGGSGGPQMRLGGLIENSLIIEGYWFSSTSSNKAVNPWLNEGKQEGCSAIVRNNVQLVHRYPSPADPDTEGKSDGRAQPGNGYTIQGASFGGIVEDNIISGAMLTDDLGFPENRPRMALKFAPMPKEFPDGKTYTIQRCMMRGNIGYRVGQGISLGEDWTGAAGHVAENNVFVCDTPISPAENLKSADQLTVQRNRFYANEDIAPGAWIGEGNTVAPYAEAAAQENWPDPDRTLKRYVVEVLHLTLLDWKDDPWLAPAEAKRRADAEEAYDPAGLKTFMAVATNMRHGGNEQIPARGKPSWTGDYPWDARFTGQAVVNWIREGFGKAPVGTSE